MRRNYERNLIPVIRSVKHISACGESTELNHGAHFWAPSTSPQNWGHLSWWGRSKRPHSNLGRCRCVLFGTGSCMAIPSAPTNHILTHWARLSIWKLRPGTTRRCVRFTFTICVVSWKSAIYHERNADRLDFQLITNCYRLGTLQNTASLSHVSGGAWNVTPFWQPKIQSSNGVHHADALILYDSTIHSDWNSFFYCVNPDRTIACDTIRRADAY